MCLSIAIKRPDYVLATGEHLGYEWNITHNGMGYRCGYVRVPIGHPWHGKGYDEVDVDCHGDLTFAAADEPCDKAGEDNAWWVGFDCGHAGDAPDPELPGASRSLIPAVLALGRLYGEVRSQEYVEDQCRSICEQAAAAA